MRQHKQKKINCGNQEVLLEILLKFQEDLESGWSNTLEKYAIKFKYILPMEWRHRYHQIDVLVLHEVFKYNVVMSMWLPMTVTMLVQLSYSN